VLAGDDPFDETTMMDDDHGAPAVPVSRAAAEPPAVAPATH
jgi:aerobic C4-dicarboxylate transport protein